MQVIITAKEIAAMDRVLSAAFVSKELDVKSEFIAKVMQQRSHLGANREVWYEANGCRYLHDTDGNLRVEFNTTAIHFVNHIADNFDHYAKVGNGLVGVGKAIWSMANTFRDEFKKLVRFLNTLDQYRNEYDYQPFDPESFKQNLTGMDRSDMHIVINRHLEALNCSDNSKEVGILTHKVAILREVYEGKLAADLKAEENNYSSPSIE